MENRQISRHNRARQPYGEIWHSWEVDTNYSIPIGQSWACDGNANIVERRTGYPKLTELLPKIDRLDLTEILTDSNKNSNINYKQKFESKKKIATQGVAASVFLKAASDAIYNIDHFISDADS